MIRDAAEQLEDESAEEPGLDLLKRWITFDAKQLAADPPAKEFIWAGRIPLGDVGTFAAAGGAGKTALLTGLAIHRAVGKPFLGRAVRQGTTVIVTAEDGREDYLRKIAAWRSCLPDLDLGAVARHVHLIDLAGVPFKLIAPQHGEYVSTAHVQMLADAVRTRARDADLIVIETVSRVGGDESNHAMSALVCASETLARLTGASVLLVAHVSQEAARRNIGDAHAPRGGTAIGANGRYTITLTGLPDDQVEEMLPGVTLSPQRQAELSVLRVPKINPAPKQDPMVLQIVPTRWGLILRQHDPGVAQLPEERQANLRRSLGENLRALAQRVASAGDALTASKLSAGLYKQVPGLRKDDVTAAVLAAVEDGYLHREPRSGHGGGHALLPGEKREGSSGELPFAQGTPSLPYSARGPES